MRENLLSWVSRIKSLYASVHSDEFPLMKYLRGKLYTWDGFGKTFLNYPMIMMMRSSNGMSIHTNSSINILICLYLIRIWCLYYAGMLDRTCFIYMFDIILFTYLSGTHVPLFYLPLLEDFQSIPLYRWGSSIFVYLYRYLCQASLEKSKQVGGCLLLLQVK